MKNEGRLRERYEMIWKIKGKKEMARLTIRVGAVVKS